MSDKPDNPPRNPMASAQRLARQELPRRFYKEAAAGPHEGGFALLLDGRVVKTPARRPLAVPSRAVAEALAVEWDRQGERIDPATMPLTRIVNAAIDQVAGEMAAVRAEIPGADIEIGPGTRAYGPHHSYAIFDITRATTDLGWAPRFPIAAGVHDYVETLRRRSVHA